MNKPYPGTQSVLRAVSILKAFDDDRPEWILTDLAREVGLNKTTAFRLLSALESEGMVSRNPSGDGYILGPEMAVLGGHALRRNNVRSIGRQKLENLALHTGETASLEVLSGNEVLIIDEVTGEHLVSGMHSIGTRWPIHGTSTGLAMLAFWPEDKLAAYFKEPLTPITSKTITDTHDLAELLQQVRACGYAVADEMLELGLLAIGAPIFDFDGQANAALSIFGPKIRLHQGRVSMIGELLRDTAASISAHLGYKPKHLKS